MVEHEYFFSPKMYRKKISYIIVIGIVIMVSLCTLVHMNEKLNIAVVCVVFFACVFTSLAIVYSKTKMKSNSKLFFKNGILNYLDIIYDGSTRNLNYKYKADHYLIRTITNMKITRDAIVLNGNIQRKTLSKFNGISNQETQTLNVVVIPKYFENLDHLINTIRESGGI